MSWNKIASDLLASNTVYDNLKLMLSEGSATINVPKIIKLTLRLLEKAFDEEKNKLIVIFPEKIYLPLLTVLYQTISNILSNESKNNNDYDLLQKGQRLKIDNYICELISSDKERIWVRWADIDNSFLKSNFPYFQKVDTKRRLSKYPGKLLKTNSDFSITDSLKQNMSFLKNSIVYVTSENKFTKISNEIKIDDKYTKEYLLCGRIKTDNTINIINKGQIHGTPAILLSNDLYVLTAQHLKNVKYIFIDYSDIIFNNQLDAFDNLLKYDIPVIIISDYINSFNFENIENRNFLTLRWDNNSLLPLFDKLLNNNINQKIANCCNKLIIYKQCENIEVSNILISMKKIRHIINNTNQYIIDLYWQLYEIIISILHKMINLSLLSRNVLLDNIENIYKKLKIQKYTISSENFNVILSVIESLKIILNEKYQLEKVNETKRIIKSSVNNIIIIIPDNEDKNEYITYWNNYISENDKNITIMYAIEYSNRSSCTVSDVIVCGWLGKKRMRNIIFCYNESAIYILLNKIELEWKKAHITEWEEIQNNESRKEFDKLFTTIELQPIIDVDNKLIKNNDDIDEIANFIQKNKYKKYCSPSSGNISVEAIPIEFVSGYFLFYRRSSKIITVTDIIIDNSENIEEKTASELKTGDFVVVRDTERSLIRELADVILEKEGRKEDREISGRWKNKLNEKRRFCSLRELHEMVTKEGTKIGIQAFRAWIENEDFIAPLEKENLLYISVALNDNYLINNIEKIWKKCKNVRAAHVKAGNEISNKLKKGIAKIISEMPKINQINIWDPIDLQLEELGKVKILKVISIGETIMVDNQHTNRLLSEGKI